MIGCDRRVGRLDLLGFDRCVGCLLALGYICYVSGMGLIDRAVLFFVGLVYAGCWVRLLDWIVFGHCRDLLTGYIH